MISKNRHFKGITVEKQIQKKEPKLHVKNANAAVLNVGGTDFFRGARNTVTA